MGDKPYLARFYVHVGDEPYLPIHSGFAALVRNRPLLLQGSRHNKLVQLLTREHHACLFAGWPEFMVKNGIQTGDILFCQLNREMEMSVQVCSQTADPEIFAKKISGLHLHKKKNDGGHVEMPCKRRLNPVVKKERVVMPSPDEEEGVFQIEMTRARLSTGCIIPAAYARYFPSGKAKINIICPDGIVWKMGVRYVSISKYHYPVLSRGWWGFQKHYKLSEDDVLCFRMTGLTTFKMCRMQAATTDHKK